MSENIELKTKNAVSVWENLSEVREQFAPTLTDKEFAFFVTLGKSLGANPFKREIWAVKYDQGKAASIFLGRDFYRMKAQEQPEYDGHVADAVYSNDKFTVENGIPKHSYSLTDRGNLLGAYSVVYKKNQTHPFFTFVKLSEYDKGQALWIKMKETLIKKVAEAQGLRGAFQGVFAGTYDESEDWTTTTTAAASKANVPPPPLKKAEPVYDAKAEPVQAPEHPAESEHRTQRVDDLGKPVDPPQAPAQPQVEHNESTVDGLRDAIRDLAATHFPNESSMALWLKTLTSNEEKGFRGIDSLDASKSFNQLKFIMGSLRRTIAQKKGAS
ncbi:MAG: phage recombination protein Bet [Candidatus Paceibacterota bacterium]|jgi:phage recombination protein Bet